MKRVLMFSFVVALVLVASAAFATEHNFTRFSVNVPADWEFDENESGVWVYLLKKNETAQISIQVGKKGNYTLSEIANVVLTDLGGTNLDKNGNYYYFPFVHNGSSWNAYIYDDQFDTDFPEGVFCVLVETGTSQNELTTIANSITVNQAWLHNIKVDGSSGGGCNSVSMTLFALLAGLALLRKK